VFLLIAIGFTGEKPPLPSPSGFWHLPTAVHRRACDRPDDQLAGM